MNSGVYFSANDNVYDWTLAFLKSFRMSNPDLALWWIPFNENSQRIAGLAEKYQFSTYVDPSFEELEKLGHAYDLGHASYGKYWFRRYAAFWGPLENFVYLDARQLVLSDLRPVLQVLEQKKLDFLYYDMALDQVYEAGPLREGFLCDRVGRGFLSGLWASRRGVFGKDEMIAFGYRSLASRTQLNPRNTDQAFINYCVDSKPALRTAQMSEYLGGYIHQAWAAQPGKIYDKDGQYFWWNYGGLEHKKKVMLLHWAGFHWNDAVPQAAILNRFSKPSAVTRIRRTLNRLKRAVKSAFWLRKMMGHV